MSQNSEPERAKLRAGDVLTGQESRRSWTIVGDEPLGYGGVSVTYLAESIGERVALKVFSPASRFHRYADALRDRFVRELEIYASLPPHEGMVRGLDSGLHEGSPWMALELCEGGTLKEKLRAGPIDKLISYKYVRQILAALEFLHGRGIIHRDVKPDNIFLKADHLKLGDLGAAKILDPSYPGHTETPQQLGSLLYISPRQLQNSTDVTPGDDHYSAGLVLHEMLTGQRPTLMETDGMSHLTQVLVSGGLDGFIDGYRRRCMQRIDLCLEMEDPATRTVFTIGEHAAQREGNEFVRSIKEAQTITGWEIPEAREMGDLGLINTGDEIIVYRHGEHKGFWDNFWKNFYEWSLSPEKDTGIPVATSRSQESPK
jgi:serine/threonine protein kinase